MLQVKHVADDLLGFKGEYLVTCPIARHVEGEMPGLRAHSDAVEERADYG